MILTIMFGLVTLVSAWGVLREARKKHFLGAGFASVSTLVFGWFTIMTFISQGWPGGAAH